MNKHQPTPNLSNKRILLILNGDPVPAEHLGQLAENSDYTIAVDGAWNQIPADTVEIDLICGDMDSARNIPDHIPVLHLPDQNAGDLEKTLEWLTQYKPAIVTVCGFKGGRIDHEWINILVLLSYSANFPIILRHQDYTIQTLYPGNHQIKTEPGQHFSLIATSPSRIILKGSHYPLNDEWLLPGSRGLSNIAESDMLDISVSGGQLILIHYLKNV